MPAFALSMALTRSLNSREAAAIIRRRNLFDPISVTNLA